MPTTTTTVVVDGPRREIERRYEVTLTPADGPLDGRLPYPPRRVNLRYDTAEADRLGALTQDALEEAAARARRRERHEFGTARDTVLDAEVRFLGQGIVDYLPRNKPRRRER